jgi:hypothetical protein
VLAVDAAEHAEVRRPEGLQTEGRGLCRLARRLNFVVEYDEYPRPAEAGLAAARTAATRFIAASLARPLSGRCEPTITTGTGTLSVRLRKYAVSSSDAVPWPITIPPRSGISPTSRWQSAASCFHSGNEIAVLGMSRNLTTTRSATSRTLGTAVTMSSACTMVLLAP